MEEENSNDGLMSIERSSIRRQRRPQAGNKKRKVSGARRVNRRKNPMKKILILTVVFGAVIFVLLTTTFSSAVIEIELHKAETEVDGVFRATRAPDLNGDITYTLEAVTPVEKEYKITDVSKEPSFTKAKGKLLVYNTNVNGESINLINKTRYKTTEGNIYRMVGSQTIPAGKIENGKFVPGTKEIEVASDEVGKDYNIDKTGVKFSIPGLARFKNFKTSYAINTTKIVGGYNGVILIPDEGILNETREKVREGIEKELRKEIEEKLERNESLKQIIFDDGIEIDYSILEERQVEDGVVIKEVGTLKAVSFRKIELANLFIDYVDTNIDTVPTDLDVGALQIEITKSGEEKLKDSKELSIRFNGKVVLNWTLDKYMLAKNLISKDKAEVGNIVRDNFDQIKSIKSIEIFPSWKSKLPGNTSKIDIIYK